MPTIAELAIGHLLLRLRPLNRALRAAVARQKALADRLIRPDVTPLCITDDQVNTLLGDIDTLVAGRVTVVDTLLNAEEAITEEHLRAAAADAGVALPLDQLRKRFTLTAFEEEAILLCIAPEIDRSYERVYGYILDDLNRRFPCVELLSQLTAKTLHDRLGRLQAIGRYGRLRRYGLLQAYGDAATLLRQELRLGAAVLDFLTSAVGDLALFRDPAEVDVATDAQPPPGVDAEWLRHLASGWRDGNVDVIGVWGPRSADHEGVVHALASIAAKPLRRFHLADPQRSTPDFERNVREALQTAGALQAILWIASDPSTDATTDGLRDTLAGLLASASTPVCLAGIHPWRPTELLAARSYAEINLEEPSYSTRRTVWEQALPEVGIEAASDLAARFHLASAEVQAVERVARTQGRLASNGHPGHIGDHIERAVRSVIRKRAGHFATLVQPRCGPEDLILPDNLHRQVLEVGQFFRAWPRVAEEWGFSRLATGGGMKALFTGDSGTGKTLAAEVIAAALGVPLLKVDLARSLSKWVGETEKNLEAAFQEAADSHSVLFFDEAEGLFGNRAEVRHGTDRYANLEVSYLLQRLEEHSGLVILASNLKDQIDAAFTRRFHAVLHFPRPGEEERLRIWRLALPKSAHVASEVDLDALAQLDMTGAAIVGAARTAALLAANDGRDEITMWHVVHGIARQYRREARIFSAAELGPHVALLERVP